MGSCLSKKTSSNCSPPGALPDPPPEQTKLNPQLAEKKKNNKKAEVEVEETAKKEIFVIKHRKSHGVDHSRSEEEKATCAPKSEAAAEAEPADFGNNTSTSSSSNVMKGELPNGGIVVRTSSCTKEEVDAILIQCGRLSRSSSTGKSALSGGGRKYSGSKRSYDFDQETTCTKGNNGIEEDDEIVTAAERIHRHRQRQQQSKPSSSSSGRRRTPSRERDQQQQRSGSRERGGGSGRRVSRSPGRRSESPITTTNSSAAATNANGSNTSNSSSGRPGKMVSVPATVSSMANNGVEPITSAAGASIKRISVKRNVGEAASTGCRTAASPRSRSPARAANSNQQQPLSLSRSNSRKAEQSPYRRNPLSEIDQNCVGFEVPPPPLLHNNKASANSNILSQAPMQKPNTEYVKTNKVEMQGTENKTNSDKGNLDKKKLGTSSCRLQQREDEGKGWQPTTSNIGMTVVVSGAESLKPQTVVRSRSSRLSRDLDINPETLLNPSPSYTALLLEDIQNFHQKSGGPAISLPPCVTKACSILEAVADLNSTTSSSLSSAVSEDRRKNTTAEQFLKSEDNFSFGANPVGMKRFGTKDPFVESEVLVGNDLTEPSFHKYVTVKRDTIVGGDGEMEEQESSGSNSFIGGQPHWISSSSREPNSADSTDRWTSSRSNTREDDKSPLGFQRHTLSEKKRESDQQHIGIARGVVSSSRGLHSN